MKKREKFRIIIDAKHLRPLQRNFELIDALNSKKFSKDEKLSISDEKQLVSALDKKSVI